MRRRCTLAGAVLFCGLSLAMSQDLSRYPADFSFRVTLPRIPAVPFMGSDLFLPQDSSTSAQELELQPRKSPALAVLLSAALPGVGGQIYTEDYWKVPVYLGLFYWFGRNFREADRLYREYRDAFSNSLKQGINGGRGDPNLQYVRDFYVNERERFATYVLITYLVNLVDAYVSASLYSFDVSGNLGGTSDVRLTLNLPFR